MKYSGPRRLHGAPLKTWAQSCYCIPEQPKYDRVLDEIFWSATFAWRSFENAPFPELDEKASAGNPRLTVKDVVDQ
jgi:hypothetical protein